MLKLSPALLGYSEDSVKAKHRQIKDLRIPKSILVNQPNILIAPINTLKIRYLILRQVATREEILSKQWYLFSQNKTYARLKYLQSISNYKISLNNILLDEKRFKKTFNIDSKKLMEIYKLSPIIIKNMAKNLYQEDKIVFTPEEDDFIEKEYLD